jgi:hypothetical protein
VTEAVLFVHCLADFNGDLPILWAIGRQLGELTSVHDQVNFFAELAVAAFDFVNVCFKLHKS